MGDETGDDRYVKVDDSKEVYTITKDSLTDILDSTMSDFYNLSVSYVSVNDLDSLEVQSADGDHTINVVTETVKAEDEDTTDDTDSDTTDESSTETSDESSTDVYKRQVSITVEILTGYQPVFWIFRSDQQDCF